MASEEAVVDLEEVAEDLEVEEPRQVTEVRSEDKLRVSPFLLNVCN